MDRHILVAAAIKQVSVPVYYWQACSGAAERSLCARLGRQGQGQATGQTQRTAQARAEPSAAYRESLRRTVEKRRQRRALRRQGQSYSSGAVGAIVPWPMPPALIIRHTREVHGEVGALC